MKIASINKWMAATKNFQDIDLTFYPNPITGDVTFLSGDDAIKRSLKHLLLTNHYERPMQPDIGCNLSALLFELMTPLTTLTMQKVIAKTIVQFERRINIIDLLVMPDYDGNKYDVKLTYSNVQTGIIQEFSFFLQRVR